MKTYKHPIKIDLNNLNIFSPQIEVFEPFAQNVDPSRNNMSAKQFTQAETSKKTETPFIISKYYTDLSEIDSPYSKIAEEDGMVIFRADEFLLVYYTTSKKIKHYFIPKSKKLISSYLSLKYVITDNEEKHKKFKKGDLLFDYTNMIPDINLPKIGYRSNILFASFFGFNADDAIVVSESFSKKTEKEYYLKTFIPITKKMRFNKKYDNNFIPCPGTILNDEKLMPYIPISINDNFMTEIINTDEVNESKYFSKSFEGLQEGLVESVKVHLTDASSDLISDMDQFNDKFEVKKEEYIYTKELIDEIKIYLKHQMNFKDQIEDNLKKLKLPDNLVDEYLDEIFTQYIQSNNPPKTFMNDLKDKFNILPEEIDFILEIDMKLVMPATRGDKYTNLFAGKGTISIILPDEVMPKNPTTGEPFEVIFNPLGIFGRNNWGTVFELGLSKIILDIEKVAKEIIETDNEETIKIFKDKIEFINNHFIKLYDEEYYLNVKEIIDNFYEDDYYKVFCKDIIRNHFYIFVPNFPNIRYNKFIEEFILPYEKEFNINVSKKEKIHLDAELITYLRHNLNFESNVFPKIELDSLFEQDIEAYNGYNYLLKLHHTSYSKYNSVAYTNSYSKVTGQPTRGRKRQGGQHISWQTTTALLGHGENSNILKELFTFKSDSREEKEAFLMKIIKDGKYYMKPKYRSNTKEAIDTALKMIGMEFKID